MSSDTKVEIRKSNFNFREGILENPTDVYVYFSTRLIRERGDTSYCVKKGEWSYPMSNGKIMHMNLKNIARNKKLVIGRTKKPFPSIENNYLGLENSEKISAINETNNALQYLPDFETRNYEELILEYLRDNFYVPTEDIDIPLNWFNDDGISRRHGEFYFLRRDNKTGLYFYDMSRNGVMLCVKGDKKKLEEFIDEIVREYSIDRQEGIEDLIEPDQFNSYINRIGDMATKNQQITVYSIINNTVFTEKYMPHIESEKIQRLYHLPLLLDFENRNYSMLFLGSMKDKNYKNRLIISNTPLKF